MKNMVISAAGINKYLGNLKPQKAAGLDNITGVFFNELRNVISPALTTTFQKSLDTGQHPKDWRSSNMAAVFKNVSNIWPATTVHYHS